MSLKFNNAVLALSHLHIAQIKFNVSRPNWALKGALWEYLGHSKVHVDKLSCMGMQHAGIER